MKTDKKEGTAPKRNAVPTPKDSITLFREESRKSVKQISTVFPFLYAGKTLMIGRPQTGKSFLQKMIAFKLSNEIKQPILILTEDMRAVAGDQIDIICNVAEDGKDGAGNPYHIDVEEAKKYITIVDQKELAKENLKYFIEYLKQHGDEFYYIFADRLSLFITGYNNSYEALSQAINNINILLADMKYNTGIMLTHHERKIDPQQIIKQSNVNSIFENANGSVAYLASTENHILIRHTTGFNVDIYVEAKLQHDPRKRKKRYSISEGEGFIKEIKEWDAFDIMSPQQKDIYIAILANLKKGIETDPSGIKDTIGDIELKTLRVQLKRMTQKGILVQNDENYQPSDF